MALLSLKPDKFADAEEIKNMLEEVLFNRDLITEVRMIPHDHLGFKFTFNTFIELHIELHEKFDFR